MESTVEDLVADWINLKEIPPDATSFEANGKEFRISPTISYEAWVDMKRTELEMGLGTTLPEVVEGLKEAYKKLNKQEFADAAVGIHNLLLGVKSIDDGRAPAILRMCTLFIHRKGDDPRIVNEEVMRSKIEDWSKGGIDMMSFFRLALGCIPGFLNAYSSLFPASSPETKPQGQSQNGNATTSDLKS